MRRVTPAAAIGLSTFLILALPLAGALLTGRHVAEFTEFPPRLEVPGDYVRFSKLAAATVAGVLGLLAASWIFGGTRPAAPTAIESHATRRLPIWGWTALAWTGAWWVLAWTRYSWF